MLKYRYVDFKIILMLALACGTLNAEVHWSEWSNCTNTGVCTRRRVVKCDEGEGIECIPRHDTNQAFEEQLRGCSSPLCENRLNLSSIASIFQQCRGDCYDARQAIAAACLAATNCEWVLHRRCHNLNSCSGTWTVMGIPQCPVTCGRGRVQQTEHCVNATGAIDYNCNGANGTIENAIRTRVVSCENDIPCPPTWSRFIPDSNSNCSVTCGGGYRREISGCVSGNTAWSTECPGSNGSQIRYRFVPCNRMPCPMTTTTLTTTIAETAASFPILPVAVGVAGVLLIIFIVTTVVVLRKRKHDKGNFKKRVQKFSTTSDQKQEVENCLYVEGSDIHFSKTPEEPTNSRTQDAVYSVADEVPTAPSGVMKVNELYIPLEMESSNVPNRFENGPSNEKVYDLVPSDDLM